MGAERYVAYGVLLGLLGYNLYFHFAGTGAWPWRVDTTQSSTLPPGATAADVCRTLKRKFHLLDHVSLVRASVSVQHHWDVLNCNSLTPLPEESPPGASKIRNSGGGSSSSDTEKTDEPPQQTQQARHNVPPPTPSHELLLSPPPPPPPPPHELPARGATAAFKAALASAGVEAEGAAAAAPNVEQMVQNRCKKLRDKFGVQPGVTWGTLPTEMQKRWAKLGCDAALAQAAVDVAAPKKHKPSPPQSPQRGEEAAGAPAVVEVDVPRVPKPVGLSPKEVLRISKLTPKQDEYWVAPVISPFAMPELAALHLRNRDWCIKMMQTYQVVPMKSWGNLPEENIPKWKDSKCDLVFTERRLALKPLPSCPSADYGGTSSFFKSIASSTSATSVGTSSSSSSKTKDSKSNEKEPLIAVMAATTTRKIHRASTKNIALFVFLLPSLIRTLDCGFRYVYVMGYDVGDPFYDTDAGMASVKAWFRINVQEPLARNGVTITLRTVRVNNSFKKPGPVFNEMARAAYKDGADYFYRVNDDTELVGHWAANFVKAVHKYSPPVAIVGPACAQGNQFILTHDFVPRIHMEIFEMNYYPPELKDWWMDDWMSLVYGRKRTFKVRKAEVIHHVKHHGMRYEVDRANEQRLTGLVVLGRQKIHKWMMKNGFAQAEVAAFDADLSSGKYEFLDPGV